MFRKFSSKMKIIQKKGFMGEMEQTDKCVLDAPIGEEIQQAF